MSAILEGNSSTIVGQLGWKGETGDSAYEIAVKHGYTGTEAQWSDDFLNAENYYDKTEADALLDDKADASDVYTKSEVDDLVEDVYSTNEVKTNKVWINGKPIYRKVLQGTTGTPSGGNTEVSTNVTIDSALDDLISLEGFATINPGDTKYFIPINYSTNVALQEYSHTVIYASVSYKRVTVTVAQAAWYNQSFYVIVEYTKTTD